MDAPIDSDCVIVGGGPVGTTLALAIAQTGSSVVLLEAGAPVAAASDDRSLALTPGSVSILRTLGVWDAVAMLATPIRALHVTDAGRFGYARIDARVLGVAALGFVVPAYALQAALTAALQQCSGCTVLRPARVEQVQTDAGGARVTYTSTGVPARVCTPLVVGADGGDSQVRTDLGIDVDVHDYGHSAVVTSVALERDHAGVAYERFTASGPFALLPRHGLRAGLVWTTATAQVPALLALNEAQFCERAAARFGARLGRFSAPGPRLSYPLRGMRARRRTGLRAILIGNAAHVVHPTAAQGLNLGLRDAAALAEHIGRCRRAGLDYGAGAALAQFADARTSDHRRGERLSDALVRMFSNDLMPLAFARNLGLSLLNLTPAAQALFLRVASGQTGTVPRLARGLSP